MDTNLASQVSWQSAFWGLMPIALNSMAQPSGKVCNCPAGIAQLLRISPVMCLLDALTVVVRLIWYRFDTGSFQAANKRIIVQRYTADDDNSGPFKDFRENTYVRWIIFAFSVPQIVKLFALQGPGVLATQVCAGVFLGSFVVVELLVVLPHAHTSIGELTETTDGIILQYSTLAASTCFMLYTIIHALVSLFEAHGLALSALHITGLTILICESVAFVPSGLHPYFLRRESHPGLMSQGFDGGSTRQNANKSNASKPGDQLLENSQPQVSQEGVSGAPCQDFNETNAANPKDRRREANILLFLIHAIPIAYYLLSYLISPTRQDQRPLDPVTSKIVATIMLVIWATLSTKWAYVNFSAIRTKDRATTRRIEMILSGYFWLLHLVGALLYYMYIYDPAGTVKPGWTDQLG